MPDFCTTPLAQGDAVIAVYMRPDPASSFYSLFARCPRCCETGHQGVDWVDGILEEDIVCGEQVFAFHTDDPAVREQTVSGLTLRRAPAAGGGAVV